MPTEYGEPIDSLVANARRQGLPEASVLTTAQLEATRCPVCAIRLGHDVHCPRQANRPYKVGYILPEIEA